MTRQVWTFSSPLEDPRFAWLDKLAEPLQQAAHDAFAGDAGKAAKNWLNGVPIRHRVHPALIIWPLGAWTTAALLDVLDGVSPGGNSNGYRKGADAAVAFGIIGALPTAAAGVADWVDTYAHERRVGMAHALLNVAALGLYGASFGLRLAGQRGAARALAGLGFGGIMMSGVLGGELVYNLGVNVPHQTTPEPPDEFVDVLAGADLPEGKPVVVDVEKAPILLLRRGEEIFAVENWCQHAGGPLSEGEIEGDEVVCPWHGSRFCLADGRPLDGPASAPLRTFEVREQGGRIALRPSYEGRAHPSVSEQSESVAAGG